MAKYWRHNIMLIGIGARLQTNNKHVYLPNRITFDAS